MLLCLKIDFPDMQGRTEYDLARPGTSDEQGDGGGSPLMRELSNDGGASRDLELPAAHAASQANSETGPELDSPGEGDGAAYLLVARQVGCHA